MTQAEQDGLIRQCYARELVARGSVTREGLGLRVDLKSYDYPTEVAILSKGDGLAGGYIIRWVGRVTGQSGGHEWHQLAEQALEAIEQQYRAGEAARRLGGIL
jgi:hypothetical protein